MTPTKSTPCTFCGSTRTVKVFTADDSRVQCKDSRGCVERVAALPPKTDATLVSGGGRHDLEITVWGHGPGRGQTVTHSLTKDEALHMAATLLKWVTEHTWNDR